MPGRYFLLLLLILTMSAAAHAQSDTTGPLLLTKSNIYDAELNDKIWRFSPADLLNGADTSLPDSHWPLTSPALPITDDHRSAAGFRGIGWLRLHFLADSSLTGIPLSMQILQDGASEIYMDGRLLERYGVLTPADSAEYYTPRGRPLPFVLMRPGPHLLAVRYANWRYLRNLEEHAHYRAGFEIKLATANGAMEVYSGNWVNLTFVMVLIMGIFLTLALIHFILFMYYRAERANLRFALFAFCFGMMFLLPLLSKLGEDPVRNMFISKLTAYVLVCTGLTLSFLLNSLFVSRRWHFYLVVAVCLAHTVLLLLNSDYIQAGMVAVIGTVSVEAVFILIRAMVRRQPGARIIGFGLLLLLALLLTLVGSILLVGDFVLKDDNPAGMIVMLLFLLSIVIIPLSMSAYLAWRFAHVSRNLKEQLLQVETLSADKQRLLQDRQEELEREVALRTEELRREKQQSDDLLLNILPAEVAGELKEKGRSEARHYDNVSVLFTDFVDFTQFSETMTPTALVTEIDTCFKAFDGIVERYGLEKIKTVGDAYIAVSGLPAENPDHAELVARAAIDIRDFMEARQRQEASTFRIRLGVHSGPVVAGIVGVKKFAYDIWGDTVNTAARMEQHSEAGRVNISAATYLLVKDRFQCSYRGSIAAKHKGGMDMYFVENTSAPAPPHSPPQVGREG